jgi:hypothetical protein
MTAISLRRIVPHLVAASLTLAFVSPARAQQLESGAPASEGLLQNLDLFAGLDGSKQPQDLGINANMGVRFSANMGVPVVKRAGLGVQAGVALNLSDSAVHVLDQIEGTSSRKQTFVTMGMFQDVSRFAWAASYDLLNERYYDSFVLGQLRGQVAYHLTSDDDAGVWFAKGLRGADGHMGETPVRLDPISQANAFVTHTWPMGARTTVWAGAASHHSDIVWVLPANLRDGMVAVYGARLELPLNERVSITGSGNFLTPAATGTVDAYLGVTIRPGRMHATHSRFAAPLMIANNPEFPVDLKR